MRIKSITDLPGGIDVGLISRTRECYDLAEAGFSQFAQEQLSMCAEEYAEECRTFPGENHEPIYQALERASHRIAVNTGLEYAELMYQKDERAAARGWLSYAKIHAKQIELDIKDKISETKNKHRDKIPTLF